MAQKLEVDGDLSELLTRYGVPVEQFGTGEAKTLEDLQKEIREGETVLYDNNGQLVRQVSVANVDVVYNPRISEIAHPLARAGIAGLTIIGAGAAFGWEGVAVAGVVLGVAEVVSKGVAGLKEILFASSEQTLYEEKQVFKKDGRVRRRGDLGTSVAEKILPTDKLASVPMRALKEELGVQIHSGQVRRVGAVRESRISPSYPGLTSVFEKHRFRARLTSGQYCPEGYEEDGEKKVTSFKWKQK